MSKANKYYYVGVRTQNGLVLVTKKDNSTRTCEWDADAEPLQMTESVATDTALGLTLNYNTAVVIKSCWEIKTQCFYVDNRKED
ncbi:MAG: hypothetical protein IJ341_02790 [Bacteroidales bacterium]|nr:hypothetical protein [Bacteroidales bacterium]